MYLNRALSQWKNQGLIAAYKVHTKRIHKYHYRIFIDLDPTALGIHYVLTHLLPDQLETVRRWINV